MCPASREGDAKRRPSLGTGVGRLQVSPGRHHSVETSRGGESLGDKSQTERPLQTQEYGGVHYSREIAGSFEWCMYWPRGSGTDVYAGRMFRPDLR